MEWQIHQNLSATAEKILQIFNIYPDFRPRVTVDLPLKSLQNNFKYCDIKIMIIHLRWCMQEQSEQRNVNFTYSGSTSVQLRLQGKSELLQQIYNTRLYLKCSIGLSFIDPSLLHLQKVSGHINYFHYALVFSCAISGSYLNIMPSLDFKRSFPGWQTLRGFLSVFWGFTFLCSNLAIMATSNAVNKINNVYQCKLK